MYFSCINWNVAFENEDKYVECWLTMYAKTQPASCLASNNNSCKTKHSIDLFKHSEETHIEQSEFLETEQCHGKKFAAAHAYSAATWECCRVCSTAHYVFIVIVLLILRVRSFIYGFRVYMVSDHIKRVWGVTECRVHATRDSRDSSRRKKKMRQWNANNRHRYGHCVFKQINTQANIGYACDLAFKSLRSHTISVINEHRIDGVMFTHWLNCLFNRLQKDDTVCLLAASKATSTKTSARNDLQNAKEKRQLIMATSLCFLFMVSLNSSLFVSRSRFNSINDLASRLQNSLPKYLAATSPAVWR